MKIDIPYNNKMFSISFGFDRNVAIATWYGVVLNMTRFWNNIHQVCFSQMIRKINNIVIGSK
jgi:hypothetical protein